MAPKQPGPQPAFFSNLCDAHTGHLGGTSHTRGPDLPPTAPQERDPGSWEGLLLLSSVGTLTSSKRHRLHIPFLAQGTQCSLCGPVLDRFWNLAAVSPCAGDRNHGHNAVDHVIYEAAQEEGLHPQNEKAGFEAVTSCFRPSQKLADTQENFPPHGQQKPPKRHPLHPSGFRRPRQRVGGDSARTLVTWISHRPSATSHCSPSDINRELAQRVSPLLHRDSARAILRQDRLLPTRDALHSPETDDWWAAWDDPGPDEWAESLPDTEMSDRDDDRTSLVTGHVLHWPRDLPLSLSLSRPPSDFVSGDGFWFLGPRTPFALSSVTYSIHLLDCICCVGSVGLFLLPPVSFWLGPLSGALAAAAIHVLHVDKLLFTYLSLFRVGFAGRVRHLEHDPRPVPSLQSGRHFA